MLPFDFTWQCLKEKLISELIIMTSYRKGKHPPGNKKNFEKPFGKFPNCKLYSIEVTPDENEREKYSPYR